MAAWWEEVGVGVMYRGQAGRVAKVDRHGIVIRFPKPVSFENSGCSRLWWIGRGHIEQMIADAKLLPWSGE